MLGHTLVLKPLAQAADGYTGCFANAGILVTETGLDQGPHLIHERCHVLATAFDSNTKSKNSTTTACRIRGVEVLTNEMAKWREDLRRRKVCRQAINDSEGRLPQY